MTKLVLGPPVSADRRHGPGIGEHVVQDRRAERSGELDEAGLVGRGIVVARPNQRDVPQAAVEGKEHARTFRIRRSAGQHDRLPIVLDPVRRCIHAARVAEERVDHGFAGHGIPKGTSHSDACEFRPLASTTRSASRSVFVPSARDRKVTPVTRPRCRGQQPGRVVPVKHAHPVTRQDARPDHPVQEIARCGDQLEGGPRPLDPSRGGEPQHLGRPVHRRRTALDHLVADPWKELFEDLRTADQQGVDVPRLRHAAAWFGSVRNVIALDDDDLVEVVTKDARGYQTRETRADNDCAMLPAIRTTHLRVPARRRVDQDSMRCASQQHHQER